MRERPNRIAADRFLWVGFGEVNQTSEKVSEESTKMYSKYTPNSLRSLRSLLGRYNDVATTIVRTRVVG